MLPVYIENKIVRLPESGCWVWMGSLDSHGYGDLRNRKPRLVHKFVYEYLCGLVPEGLELDHLCRTHCCVNPYHLDPVTHKENCQRGKVGQYKKEFWSNAKICKHGHPWTLESTYIRPDNGLRYCKICRRAREQKYREKNRA